MNTRFFVVILLMIVVAIFWWQPISNAPKPTSEQEQFQDITPEFTSKLLHQEIYDKEGNIQQEIFSQSMEHFSELALTHFKQPEFIIYQNDKPYWRLSAQIGTLHEDSLILDQKVVMVQIVDNTLVNKISTEYLEINLSSNFVTSDQSITIEGNNVYILGKGLTADLNQGSIKLTNHVQTRIY